MRRFTKIPNSTDEKISTGHTNKNVVKGNTRGGMLRVQCTAPSLYHRRNSRVSYWPNRRKEETRQVRTADLPEIYFTQCWANTSVESEAGEVLLFLRFGFKII